VLVSTCRGGDPDEYGVKGLKAEHFVVAQWKDYKYINFNGTSGAIPANTTEDMSTLRKTYLMTLKFSMLGAMTIDKTKSYGGLIYYKGYSNTNLGQMLDTSSGHVYP